MEIPKIEIDNIQQLFTQGNGNFQNALGVNKESFNECIELQKSLNEFMVPEWQSKNLNFRLAAILENAELLDSFNWKWWKKTETDWLNVEIELIDLFHFIISYSLLLQSEQLFLNFLIAEEAKKLNSNEEVKRNDELKNKIIEKMSITFNGALSNNIVPVVIQTFCECWFMLGENSDSLFRKYKMKNVLNKFRKNHGYKEGTYIKIWNGLEDNIVALNIQKELDDNLEYMNNLYSKLEEEYSKLEKNNENETTKDFDKLTSFVTNDEKTLAIFQKIDKEMHPYILDMLERYKKY